MMSATSYRLGRGAAAGAEAEFEGRQRDDIAGSRRRLTLAVLWLAGLIAWGLVSYLSVEPTGDDRGAAASAGERLDGHGKWTGYTAGWRSRSQILQDAGITGRD